MLFVRNSEGEAKNVVKRVIEEHRLSDDQIYCRNQQTVVHFIDGVLKIINVEDDKLLADSKGNRSRALSRQF